MENVFYQRRKISVKQNNGRRIANFGLPGSMRKLIKSILYKWYLLALQYEREIAYEQHGFPINVRFFNVSFDGNIEIGEFTYINDGTRVDSGKNSKVRIGRYCAIGRNVHITAKDHNLIRPTADDSHGVPLESECDTTIGNEVWIGDYVFVKSGVKIGDRAVIGAHSFVHRDVEPYEVVGGCPIKHIRLNSDHYKYKK